MNREALFCDGTQDYVIPAEPKENEKIKIRFRTAHNDVEEVHILTGNSSYPMWKIVSEGEFDFYEIEWQLSDVPFSYLFEVKSGDQICYFSRCGVSDQREDFYAFGQKARLCIRFLWIGFVTAIRQMTWRTGNIFISALRA